MKVEVRDIPLEQLREAPWNPNEMDEATLRRLANSLGRFGAVLPLVVRPIEDGYEVIGGNQRLVVCRQENMNTVPCVLVNLDDVQARLLAQALNRVRGEDDINRKAALVKQILSELPEEDVLAILPETASSLQALASLGQQTAGSLAAALSAWEKAKAVKLERVSFALDGDQIDVVEEAIDEALSQIDDEGPNRRGAALALICTQWLGGSDV
jgi:ParB family chromosome partitioning protein